MIACNLELGLLSLKILNHNPDRFGATLSPVTFLGPKQHLGIVMEIADYFQKVSVLHLIPNQVPNFDVYCMTTLAVFLNSSSRGFRKIGDPPIFLGKA